MTHFDVKARPSRPNRPRWTTWTRLLALPLAFALPSGVAWAYWSTGSVPGGNGASAATTVHPGATPTAVVAGRSITVGWAATTLATGQPVTGYRIKRYDAATAAPQTILSACTGTTKVTTCTESDVPVGSWKYTVTPVFATNWQGAESAKSSAVTVELSDTTPPVNAISMSLVTGQAAKSGNTIYYNGSRAGSFILTNAVTDSGSGPASSATAALGGTSTGWTHTPSKVLTPSTGPYVSTVFSWGSCATSAPTEVVTGRDVAGNTAITTLSFVNDSTSPKVLGVSSPLANGTYKAGQVIPVTITFSEPVTVTGTPRLTLNTGSPATTAVNYTSGSGSAVLTFSYTVVAGNASADLGYAATTALALNGGTIRDVATNNATLTLAPPGAANSLSANKDIVINTTSCTPGSSTVTATSDAWIDEKDQDQNNGHDGSLRVQSENGHKNQRALVGFTLPTLPAGCAVTSATLRLYNESADSDRTIDVYRAAAAWVETTVTWDLQPGTAGIAAGTDTTATEGPQSWTVTAHVQDQYTGVNHGFVIRDRTEDSASARSQGYRSREECTERPSLVISWG